MRHSTELYDRLGLEPDATADEIKEAWRKRVNKCHPDRATDPEDKDRRLEQTVRINEAYAVLKDPDSRAHYDRTGDIISHSERVTKMHTIIANCLMKAVQQISADGDVIMHMKQQVTGDKGGLKAKRNHLKEADKKLKKVLKKLKFKDAAGRSDFLGNFLRDQERLIQDDLRALDSEEKLLDDCLEIIGNYYEYAADVQLQQISWASWTAASLGG